MLGLNSLREYFKLRKQETPPARSKYTPHQGKREKARRVKQSRGRTS